MIIATTARLILRPFELADAPALLRMNADPEVLKHVGDTPLKNLAAAEALVHHMHERYARDQFGRWSVVHRDTDEFVGWCGLRTVEREGVDLGYRFLREHWGQGYATESAQACVEVGFRQFGLPYLLGRNAADNHASWRVLQKLGFEFWMTQSVGDFERVNYSILPRPDHKPAEPADPVFTLGRLHARILQPDDQLNFFLLEGNPNVLRYADGELLDYKQAGESIARLRSDAISSDAELRVFAVSADAHPFLGTVATVHDGTQIEIGFRLQERHWNQGWGHKLGALAVSLARHLYPNHLIVARYDLQNPAVLRIAERLGGHRQPDANNHAHWHWPPKF